MKKIQIIGCLLVMLMQTTIAGISGEGDFKQVKQENGVTLYERWITGSEGEKIREVKAVFTARTDVESVVNLLTDQTKGKQWNTNARDYNVITTGVRTNWITYIRYNIPWPMGDQDCCLSYRVSKDACNPRAGTISFESTISNQFPVTSSVTRIAGTKGRWQLEDAQNGTIRITYIVSTSRNKKVPRWIADPIVRNNLVSTMTTFRDILEKQ